MAERRLPLIPWMLALDSSSSSWIDVAPRKGALLRRRKHSPSDELADDRLQIVVAASIAQ